MSISIEEFIGTLKAIKYETKPIDGHPDPGAIDDCWRTVFEFIEENYGVDEMGFSTTASAQPDWQASQLP